MPDMCAAWQANFTSRLAIQASVKTQSNVLMTATLNSSGRTTRAMSGSRTIIRNGCTTKGSAEEANRSPIHNMSK